LTLISEVDGSMKSSFSHGSEDGKLMTMMRMHVMVETSSLVMNRSHVPLLAVSLLSSWRVLYSGWLTWICHCTGGRWISSPLWLDFCYLV